LCSIPKSSMFFFVSGSLLCSLEGLPTQNFPSNKFSSFLNNDSLLFCARSQSPPCSFLCRGVSSALFVSGSLLCSFCVEESPLLFLCRGVPLLFLCRGVSSALFVSRSPSALFVSGSLLCSLEGLPTQNFPSNKFLHSLITIH